MRTYLKALIFDLDGTLADTIPAISEAVNDTLSALGYPSRTVQEIQGFIGRGPRYLMEQALPSDARSEDTVSKALALYDKAYAKTYMHTDRMYEGLYDVMSSLSEHYKIAVLSNKQDEYVKALAAQLLPSGVYKMARGSVNGSPAKPSPDAALEIASTLGVSPSECIIIGDSEIDIATAENAGFDILSVSWGYASKSRLIAKGAQEIVETPDELLDYFLH